MNFYSVQGVSLAGELKYSIKKKEAEPLRPIFEAFNNAWESIKEKKISGKIEISLHLKKDLSNEFVFDCFVIKDNGVGINEKGYERLKTLRDASKSSRNFGTGRVQYVHSFDETKIKSVSKWLEDRNSFRKLELVLSKKDLFLAKNAILREDENKEVDETETFCEVSFYEPLIEKERNFFGSLTAGNLKDELKKHFLPLFSNSRNFLPKITISVFKADKETEKVEINSECIPNSYCEFQVEVPYSKKEENKIVSLDKKETFEVKSFELDKNLFPQGNSAFFVSKDEIAQKIEFKNFISKEDDFSGKYYLFLISGEYLDRVDSDDRGNLKLVSRKEFAEREESPLIPEEILLRDNIEENTKIRILEKCPAIKEAMQHSSDELEKIQKEFLLSDALIKRIRNKIKVNASTEEVLQIAYKENVEDEAKEDFAIQQWRDDVKKLNPDDPDFQKKLEELEKNYTKKTSIEKRTELTRYVARRKIVLEAFDSILTKELNLFQEKGRINESILHNLIFRKKSAKVDESNLWLISEDFIHFKGTSDLQLDDILIDGKRFFKSDDEIKNINLSSEESDFRTELLKTKNESDKKRPDILLFPQEGKCIIIELKAPDVDVSKYLHQIKQYASMINSFTMPDFKIKSFYGYLIGENINVPMVRFSDPNFERSYDDSIVCPNTKVIGIGGASDGFLYTEILKYSTLLKRAQLRNKIFIEKLGIE